MPELVLLTHATEFDRPTNTGRLVLQTALENLAAQTDSVTWQVRTPLWQRKCPDPALIASIKAAADNPLRPYVLLFPATDARTVNVDMSYCPTNDVPAFPAGFILLDATWQQAQKMYNQSPYLHALPKWQIVSTRPSTYMLRRNQKQQGWCTAEIVMMLWGHLGAIEQADQLEARFMAFNQR